MNYKPVYPDYDFKEITINWSQPFSLEVLGSKKKERIANHQKAYFYKLLGKRNNKFELFYIGQTQSQFVSQRLANDDHQKKKQRFKKDHPKHRLYISVGIIESPENIKDTSINNTESLLIYSHCDLNPKYFKNVKNTLTHNVTNNFRIINKGFKRDKMRREIAYGLFFK